MEFGKGEGHCRERVGLVSNSWGYTSSLRSHQSIHACRNCSTDAGAGEQEQKLSSEPSPACPLCHSLSRVSVEKS